MEKARREPGIARPARKYWKPVCWRRAIQNDIPRIAAR